MSHKVIILPDGTEQVIEHDGEGNRAEPVTMTAKQIVKLDHAPSEITIQSPTMELTKVILKAVEKYFKKQ